MCLCLVVVGVLGPFVVTDDRSSHQVIKSGIEIGPDRLSQHISFLVTVKLFKK